MNSESVRKPFKRRSELAKNGIAIIESIAVHAVFGVVLIFGLSASTHRIDPVQRPVIQAAVVSRQAVVEQLESRREAELDAARQQAIERRRAEEQTRREQEAKVRAEQERRQREEAQAQAMAEAERKRREAAERERQIQAERQKQLEDLQRQRREAEKAAEAERQRLEQIAEQRRQQEADRQARLEEERRRQLLDLEAQQLADARQATLEEEWVASIRILVTQNWRRPPSARSGTVCMVRVDQLPGGDVVSASVMAGCEADEITRRSIIDAVMRSEPLPYRGYESVFRRQLTFEFVVN
ncbi:MAG: cell envelope integrity protein TolA [Xanthomonadales bacterium]|nr:cell envelope integrity protein TolA [Xanthomonadales bacterium]